YAAMALATAAGRLTLGNMTLYLVAFRQGQQAFQSVLGAIGDMYEHNLYMSNLFQYLSIPPSPLESNANPNVIPFSLGERGIRFENVGFRYPTQGDRWALRGLDLFIPPGQSVA